MNLQQIRQKFERKKGRRDQVVADLKTTSQKIKDIKVEISNSEAAQDIITAVANLTQSELSYRITEPVSLALSAVYPSNPYQMVADFRITGKGYTECHLFYERNGNRINPLSGGGGGPVDVGSFALRVGSWSLAQPRSRNFMGFDEVAKWIQRDKVVLFGQMLKEVSDQLGLQILMVSHMPELISVADRIIWMEKQVDNKNEISVVKFAGDLDSFVSFLNKERDDLKNSGQRPSTYQKHLYEYFL